VKAARALFVERGFTATTIEAISEAADVPTATVYRLFGSKLGILKSLLDVSIGGDDEDVAVADRVEVRAMLAERDPREQLAAFVRITMAINGRTAPVYGVLESAAASEPDARPLLEELTRQRSQGQRTLARSLARQGALCPGLRERDAADVIHALLSPELYRLLVVERGWKVDRYEGWLREILIAQLLRTPAS
jgi:AcrR family transcriptional regulator